MRMRKAQSRARSSAPREIQPLMQEEMRWYAENEASLEAEYFGKWIAFDKTGLVGVGETLHDALEMAKEKGVEKPLVTGIRSREYQGIWLATTNRSTLPTK
jgi:Family of unknown function (DUF5678)